MVLAIGVIGVAAPSKEDAEASAKSWLALIDSGRYDDSWTELSSMTQAGGKQQQWVEIMKQVRDSLGPVPSRKLQKITLVNSLHGVQVVEYALLQFDTSFANKAEAVETVTVISEGGKRNVAGYSIK
jgi:hypothetical protein